MGIHINERCMAEKCASQLVRSFENWLISNGLCYNTSSNINPLRCPNGRPVTYQLRVEALAPWDTCSGHVAKLRLKLLWRINACQADFVLLVSIKDGDRVSIPDDANNFSWNCKFQRYLREQG